jgi:hypothetical protein
MPVRKEEKRQINELIKNGTSTAWQHMKSNIKPELDQGSYSSYSLISQIFRYSITLLHHTPVTIQLCAICWNRAPTIELGGGVALAGGDRGD